MTEPYYQDDYVTLYHGDCLEHPEWWTGADVLVTDPPYGVEFRSARRSENERHERIKGDSSVAARDAALALWDGPALVFGTWRAPRPEATEERLLWVKGDDPGNGGDLASMPWGRTDEEIYVIGRKRGLWQGPRRSNVYRLPKVAHANNPGHPTPKPVPLMEMLIGRCPTGVVADPFAGSGSTLVAAKRLGCKAVGVELEEKYCEIAARRLSQEVLDLAGVTL